MGTKYSIYILLGLAVSLGACSGKYLKYEDDSGKFAKVEEFDRKVQIKEVEVAPVEPVAPAAAPETSTPVTPEPPPVTQAATEEKAKPVVNKTIAKKKAVTKVNSPVDAAKPVTVQPRLPDFEDRAGFAEGQRRPLKDPFRVGESVVHKVSYFKATAGMMTFTIPSMVEVNGKKAYRMVTSLKTSGIFERFYSVDDWAETLMDFETLVPSVFTLHVKESGQLKEARAIFENSTQNATFWEKKYTKEKGMKEKKVNWKMLAFSQNVFSAAFYQRVFDYQVGKKYQFNVAEDGKNIMFSATCLRRETIETEAGEFKTIVIKPEFSVSGVFQPSGDIYFWLTDDERKLLVRIEADIKIGTLVTEAVKVNR